MIKVIVTDIEGTTSSLSFVKDVLFPYARQHLADFVRQHQHASTVNALLNDARQLSDPQADIEQLIPQLIDWIDRDQKITPLKALQGLIWEDGYRQGAFQGHIYEDAVECLRSWKAQGYDLYIYSSGSVHAQKLLFAHTEYGDLTPLFSGYFDTHIGGKKEVASYQAIIEQVGQPADTIVFLSDIKEELDAARIAGLQTYWLTREQTPDPQADHRQVANFSAIQL
jgi:enolase-phosphatase E1